MTLPEAVKEMEKFVSLKTTMRPLFADVIKTGVMPVGQWIPCRVALPNHEDHVLCCTATAKGRKNIVIGYYCKDLERWASGMNSNVIAWMELPEPYEEAADV